LTPADLIEDRVQVCASLVDVALAYPKPLASGWLPLDRERSASLGAVIQAKRSADRVAALAWQPTDSPAGGLEAFAPLFDIAGLSWVALPMGAIKSPLAQFLSSADCPLIFEPSWTRDGLKSVAGLIGAVDLVFSNEDLAAALAGALGTPAWKMAGAGAHWSWGADGATSKWHPNVRTMRTTQGIEPVVAAIRAELEQIAGG